MIDIMLPYWGEPEYLFASVRSVQEQSDGDWHLTVVDDCYPDESVPDFFARLSDPRITYLRNHENIGIIQNFRKCHELAVGEYVTFMGCDDIMLPNYVSSIKETVRNIPGVTIVQPGVDVIDAHGEVYLPLADRIKRLLRPRASQVSILRGEPLAVSLLIGDWLYWPSLAFRTEAIRNIDFGDYDVILDLDFVLSLVTQGADLALLPETAFYYRRHKNSLSSTTLLDGHRFHGERDFFAQQVSQMDLLGWHRASRAARQHLASRAYAASLIPNALLSRESLGILLHHVIG